MQNVEYKHSQEAMDFAHKRDVQRLKELMDRFVEEESSTYVIKGHFGTEAEKKFLLNYGDRIKIFHIWRDLADTVLVQRESDNRGSELRESSVVSFG